MCSIRVVPLGEEESEPAEYNRPALTVLSGHSGTKSKDVVETFRRISA